MKIVVLEAEQVVRAGAVQMLVLAAALVGARLFARHRAALRHALLSASLAAACVAPFVGALVAPAIGTTVGDLVDRVTWAHPTPTDDFPPTPGRDAMGAGVDPASRSDTQPFRPNPSGTRPLDLGPVALALWALGASFLLVRLAHGALRARAIRRSAREPLPRPAALALAQARVPRLVPVLIGDVMAGPVTIGVWRPVVLIPGALAESLDDEALAHVLVHETMHALRRDPLWAVLQRVATAIFWPNPLVHATVAALMRAREEICDNAAVRATNAGSYALVLLTVAERASGLPGVASAPLHEPSMSLERRIADLFVERRSLMTKTSFPAKAALLVSMTTLGALGCAHRSAERVAFIDLKRALLATQDGQKARASLKADFQVKQAELDRRQEALKVDHARYEREKAQLSAAERLEREARFRRELEDVQKVYQQSQRALSTSEDAEMRAIETRMKPIIKDIAASKRLLAIVDRSKAVYLSGDLPDVTNELIARYEAQRAQSVR